VVYHGGYVRFFERGRTDFLRLAGVHHAALLERPDPLAFTVTRLAIDFRHPARIDDALQVRTRYEAARGPRLFIRQKILRGETLVAEAEVEAACIDLAGRARRPPADLVAALKPFFA
jgi:acyl-CoA thioester hydrolase